MPIYEYEFIEGACDECPGKFEAFQRINDEALTECPKCHRPVLRLISAVAIHKPLAPTTLKETGMTRLKRLERGVYQAEGAESGIVDLSAEVDTGGDDSDDEPNVLDLSNELGDQYSEPEPNPIPDPGEMAPTAPKSGSGKKKTKEKLPFYDMRQG